MQLACRTGVIAAPNYFDIGGSGGGGGGSGCLEPN